MVTAPQHPPSHLTPEEYFAWEEQQELRYEYFDGEVFAMTGESSHHAGMALNLTHADISLNIASFLRGQVKHPCKVRNSDAKLGITAIGPFTYPDVSVSCDERDRNTQKFTSYPCLIIEVLSPGTEAYDRGGKFALYRRLESLQEYVLVSTATQSVEVFRRQENGIWQYQAYAEGDVVELRSVGLTLLLEVIYEDVLMGGIGIEGKNQA